MKGSAAEDLDGTTSLREHVERQSAREASCVPPDAVPSTLSRQQENFILDRFSTKLEDPTTGLKIQS